MHFALQPRFYAHVPVYLWPWVLWQILGVMAWSDETGRAVAFSVNQNGRLYVDHIADDPNAPRAWQPGDLTASIPNFKLLSTALNPITGLSTALSMVHARGEASSRNPLRAAAPSALSAVQNQTSPNLLPALQNSS